MPSHRLSLPLLAFLILPLAACVPGAKVDVESHHDLNAGYASLYSLMHDESSVSGILILKTVKPPVKQLIDDIAKAADDARKALLQYAKDDQTLGFKKDEMPALEVKTRDAIASTTTRDLFKSSGPEFELRLLLTQTEALRYASHLSTVIAKADPNPARKKALEDWSANFEKLRARILALLAVK